MGVKVFDGTTVEVFLRSAMVKRAAGQALMRAGWHRTLVLWTLRRARRTLAAHSTTSSRMKTIALVASITAALASACFAQAPADDSAREGRRDRQRPRLRSRLRQSRREGARRFLCRRRRIHHRRWPHFQRTRSHRGRHPRGTPGATAARSSRSPWIRSACSGRKSVLEKGSTTVTAKDGETSSALYTAIHVKKDGKWKISQLVESPVPDADAARPARGTRVAHRRMGGDGQDGRPDRPQPVSLGARRQFPDAAT